MSSKAFDNNRVVLLLVDKRMPWDMPRFHRVLRHQGGHPDGCFPVNSGLLLCGTPEMFPRLTAFG